ncbi:glycosyltransferase family 39 protein [Bacillus sp. Xin]|uniref:glycosyltransferase family 39 protein n=1 Tax=unclassified Bacillus (in: firmicutes) TaxID=185979 RepID=UPI0015731A88|nr:MULTISPECIES: glycosyltransferase family 39 protein [unclassified Bacillus (in: firmicutes)]MBC6971710.1 glycosyltransferase family 39 protein [Bacillus sp. Xin]NSW36615.1 glycosyltransferase family 39 protein [Bacillus sp. Xin1]
MNHIQTGFSSFFSKMIIGTMLAFFVYSCWNAFEGSKQFLGGSATSLTIVLSIFVILLLLLSSILQYRFTDKQFLIFLMSMTVLIRLGAVLFFDAPVIGDMRAMYETAKQVALGSSNITLVSQIPFIIYESVLIRVFGDATFVLQLCNVLYCAGTTFFIYRIAAILFQEECGRIAAVFYSLYLPNILSCSLLTGESLSIFLFYFASYILLHKGLSHSYTWACAAILFAISNMMYPVGVFILILVIVYVLLVEIFQSADKQNVLLKLIGVLAVFYATHFAMNYGIQAMGIKQYAISNDAYVQSVLIGEERNKQETVQAKSMKERLNQKLNELETERLAAVKPSVDQLSAEGMNGVLLKGEKLIFLVVSLFMSIALLHFLIQKQKSEGYMFLLLLITGYIGMKLLNKDMVYSNLTIPSLFILQSLGVYMLSFYCQKLFFKK